MEKRSIGEEQFFKIAKYHWGGDRNFTACKHRIDEYVNLFSIIFVDNFKSNKILKLTVEKIKCIFFDKIDIKIQKFHKSKSSFL